MLRLVVLISGGGSNLRSLLDASDDAEFPARVVAIGADRDAEGLAHAEEFGIPSFVVPFGAFDSREAWGDELLDQLRQWEADLVILSGFMRLLPPRVVDALSPALLNTHPAYLPEFPGAHAVRDALAAGVTETGASVIVVDNGMDSGPVLAQRRIPVLPGDTEARLHDRIKVVERQLLVDVVLDIANGGIDLHGSRSSDNAMTLQSYEIAADRYAAAASTRPREQQRAFLERLTERIGQRGHLLEIGSGPGFDADTLEALGLRVERTDAANSFLGQMSERGKTPRLLNAIADELGGPYDGIFANAVFLHFSRDELRGVLAKARAALKAGGALAFSVKDGDGEAWSDGKLGHPRHFTYWREPALRDLLRSTGWQVESLDRVAGVDDWLYVIASPAT